MPSPTSVISTKLSLFILKKTGIVVVPGQQALLENRIELLCKDHGFPNADKLLEALEKPSSGELLSTFISNITINESLWFRDGHPFEIMVHLLKEQLGHYSKVRIWSAACSTGQEPYSLAIKLAEAKVPLNKYEIFASDLSPKVIEQAKSGRYDEFSISRGLSKELLLKYFHQQESQWVIQPELRKNLDFKEVNLSEKIAHLGQFNMVLIRNVLIYFSDEFRKNLIQRIYDQLLPGGIVFVGGCESILDVHPHLKLKNLNNTLYYQKEAP